ncbi:MAG: PHP domain-containing protein [Treponema sp.]|uniref:PHP domain-containing protein n=1 Tax=Treponema sp. TaxID=166 RepID=UPI003FA281AF
MIDLHTHSTVSDGTFSPAELAAEAHKTGLSLFALTDHDTVAGVAEAQQAGKELGIGVLPGIEISVTWQPGELHLLGLGIDPENKTLQDLMTYAQGRRQERNIKIIERFNEAGIPIDLKKLAGIAGGAVIGRPHFAKYLVQEKKAKNIQEAFQNYLGKGRPFYIEKECLTLAESIQAIKAAHGIPVLAHPMSLYLSWGKLPETIAHFKEEGLIGLEAWHSGARYGECLRLEALAEELGLLVTAGSDFHGANRKDVHLGRTTHNIPIEDRFFTDNLLPALAKVNPAYCMPSGGRRAFWGGGG